MALTPTEEFIRDLREQLLRENAVKREDQLTPAEQWEVTKASLMLENRNGRRYEKRT